MTKVLVIADDFTGALDTGVQFAKKDIRTRVISHIDPEHLRRFDESDAEVIVINADTRHLSGDEAYNIVYHLVNSTRGLGIRYLYKKTDSALRGNVGKELEAFLNASDEEYLTFVPAYPDMNRITKNGVHYIDGLPVSDSSFGRDLSEPVKYSDIEQLMGDMSVAVERYPVAKQYQRTDEKEIGIFDAVTNRDIENIIADLTKKNTLGVMAGCAGFAGALAKKVGLEKEFGDITSIPRQFFVICGSVNEITKEQLDFAEKSGITRISLSPEQIYNQNFLDTEEGSKWFEGLAKRCKNGESCIVETGIDQLERANAYRCEHGMTLENARKVIADFLGTIANAFVKNIQNAVLMIIGGDTWTGCLEKMGWPEISIYKEIESGVVLSAADIDDQKHWLISKSGGFGHPELLTQLEDEIVNGRLYSV